MMGKKNLHIFHYPQLQPENQANSAFLKKDIDQYSSCPSVAGLWLSCVTIVWHAAGDEGAIRRNSAETMEYHLQVQCDVPAARLMRVSPCIPACLFTHSARARCTDLTLFSHKGAASFGIAAHTCSCWVVGNFLILVLKFYNQPERGSLLKQTSGTFFTLQNG